MKFNIMAIIFMIIAIALGSLIGSGLASMLGFAGGIIGTLLVGFIIYVIYAFLSGGKIAMWSGLIFAVMVWLANMLAGSIQGATGFGGGLIGLFVTAIVLSFLWGYFGKGTETGITSTSTTKRSKGKRRR